MILRRFIQYKNALYCEIAQCDDQEEIQAAVLEMPETIKWLEGKEPKKVIVVHGRIVNTFRLHFISLNVV